MEHKQLQVKIIIIICLATVQKKKIANKKNKWINNVHDALTSIKQ